MSGVNITCNIGSQLGNGSGEMKFDVTSKDSATLATCIASEIVNEILENALDIASLGNSAGLTSDTIAFSVDDDLCRFVGRDRYREPEKIEEVLDTHSFSNYPDDSAEECPNIAQIMEGLSSLRMPNQNAEEPVKLDIEMKRLLTEMMSPPYDIINYETLPRKDGVGDQPVEEITSRDEEPAGHSDDCLVDPEKTRIVEKKTRVTDLVMNSKQVLSEYLMTEESRKQQEQWEESNEEELRVTELNPVQPSLEDNPMKMEEAECPMEEIIVMNDDSEDFSSLPADDCLETIELDSVAAKGEGQKKTVSTDKLEGGGDDSKDDSKAGSSHLQVPDENVDPVAGIKEVKCKGKFEMFKKKKWNINLKIFGIGKKKHPMATTEKTTL